MPYHDAFEAESQLNALLHRARWEQALKTLDDWLVVEPWRTELLLRKAQLFRALHRYEQGLAAVRAYRAKKADAGDLAFLEVEFLLALRRTDEAMSVLDALPVGQAQCAQAAFYRGRVLLERHEILSGLQHLWNAYQQEPGYNRALIAWASVAIRYYGRWWVRRQLAHLQAQRQDNPTIAVSVGLALNMIDSRHGQHLLRRAVERYTDDVPSPMQQERRKPVPPQEGAARAEGAAEAYRHVSEQLLAGHFGPGLDAYYHAISADPSWTSVLAPLVAEVLVDELVRPEEARLLLEDALRREPTDYRLHLSYTKVFLHLGFGEEALSAANCALVLAPEEEKSIALAQRATAHLLLGQRDPAEQDLRAALTRLPEVRDLITEEPTLHPLLRERRFRSLLSISEEPFSLWQRIKRWWSGGEV